jgi:hypothetical protein
MARLIGKAILVACLSVLSAVSAAERELRIAIPDRTESFPTVPRMQARLERAYARLGVTVKWVPLPLQRSEAMLIAGTIDGELVRRAMPDEFADKVVRVDEPLQSLSTAAFVTDPAITLEGPEGLVCCRVGIVRNFRTSEQLAANVFAVERAATFTNLVQMLKAGRVDIILGVYPSEDSPRSALGAQASDSSIRVAHAELRRSFGYHYLTARHAALAASLAELLRQEAKQASSNTNKR